MSNAIWEDNSLGKAVFGMVRDGIVCSNPPV
jgi:hypothetical protein